MTYNRNLVRTAVKGLVRRAGEARGYWWRHRSVLPFGIDYLYDIQRLASQLGVKVETVFDVGANIGQTIDAVRATFPDCRVWAFEPHPETFRQLEKNLRDERTSVYNVALSNHEGEAEFFEYGTLATCNSLTEKNPFAVHTGNASRRITVACTTLDRFCDEQSLSKLDVLKIDTEGHEFAVLEGGVDTLRRRGVRFVYVEFSSLSPRSGRDGGALAPIAALLEAEGFVFVASYPELMLLSEEIFVTANAVFVRYAPAHDQGV